MAGDQRYDLNWLVTETYEGASFKERSSVGHVTLRGSLILTS